MLTHAHAKVPGRFSPPLRPEYEAKGDLLVAVYIMLRKPEKMGGGGGDGKWVGEGGEETRTSTAFDSIVNINPVA